MTCEAVRQSPDLLDSLFPAVPSHEIKPEEQKVAEATEEAFKTPRGNLEFSSLSQLTVMRSEPKKTFPTLSSLLGKKSEDGCAAPADKRVDETVSNEKIIQERLVHLEFLVKLKKVIINYGGNRLEHEDSKWLHDIENLCMNHHINEDDYYEIMMLALDKVESKSGYRLSGKNLSDLAKRLERYCSPGPKVYSELLKKVFTFYYPVGYLTFLKPFLIEMFESDCCPGSERFSDCVEIIEKMLSGCEFFECLTFLHPHLKILKNCCPPGSLLYSKVLRKVCSSYDFLKYLTFLKPHLQMDVKILLDHMMVFSNSCDWNKDEYESCILNMIKLEIITLDEYVVDHLERHLRDASNEHLDKTFGCADNQYDQLYTVFGLLLPKSSKEINKAPFQVFSNVLKNCKLDKAALITKLTSKHPHWTRGYLHFNTSKACIAVAKCLQMEVKEVRAIAERAR